MHNSSTSSGSVTGGPKPASPRIRAYSGYKATVVCALEAEGPGRCRRCDRRLRLDAEASMVLERGGLTVCEPCMNTLLHAHPGAIRLYPSP